MTDSERFMRRALELAKRAEGQTSPNPAVGAVIVQDGGIVGEGWHEYAGAPHAEAAAIKAAGRAASGGTMYVTLEPCHIYGRTPPCGHAIIKAGLEKVIYGSLDPNPAVSGRGVEVLREAGVEVEQGQLEAEITRLNEAYNKHVTTGLPFLTAKIAMSLDGKISARTGDAKWLTGEASRQRVHELRRKSDAVITGLGTVVTDDPMLNVRLDGYTGRQPLRVIADETGALPADKAIIRTAGEVPTLVAVAEDASKKNIQRLTESGADVLAIPKAAGGISLPHLLRELGLRGVCSALVEAGPGLLTALINEDLIDKYIIFIAAKLVGGHKAPGFLAGQGIATMAEAVEVDIYDCEKIGEDALITAYPKNQIPNTKDQKLV